MIETHAHLDFPDFDEDRATVIAHSIEAGVSTIINIGTDFPSCERVLAIADEHPCAYAAVGVHPHDAKSWDGEKSIARLTALAKHPKVVAIGEIGLDYFRDRSPRNKQKEAFVDQIGVARELKLPIVIHNRDAFGDIMDALVDSCAFEVGGVMHCFSEGPEEAQRTIDLGFHLSVNGILTYKGSTMADVGRTAQLNRIILETDCPFLTPHPFRGKRNAPTHIPLIAAKLAELRGCTVAEIEEATDANARRLFRLPPSN